MHKTLHFNENSLPRPLYNSLKMSKNTVQQHALPKIVTGKAPPRTLPNDAVSQCPLSSVPRFSVLSSDGRDPIPHSRIQVTSYVQRTKLTGTEAKYRPEEGTKIIDGQ
jgi:hypothetical protein